MVIPNVPINSSAMSTPVDSSSADSPDPGASRTATHDRLIAPLRRFAFPIGVFLWSRLLVWIVALSVTWYKPESTVRNSLTGWDAGWFLRIAEFGYPNSLAEEAGGGSRWAFFPLFPFLIRITARVLGLKYATAGILLTLIVGALAVAAVYAIARDRFGEETAKSAALLLSFFPTSYVLSMVYSDGLFILFAALALHWIGKERWLWAGLAISGASLTRGFGTVLMVAGGVEALLIAHRARSTKPLRIALTAPLGYLLWTGYQWRAVGDPFAFKQAYTYWHTEFVWFKTPFSALWSLSTETSAWHTAQQFTAALALAFAVAGMTLLGRAHLKLHRVPVSWWIYGVGSTLLTFSPNFATSYLRYSMSIIPAVIGVACHLGARSRTLAIGTFAMVHVCIAFIAFVGLLSWQTAPFAP